MARTVLVAAILVVAFVAQQCSASKYDDGLYKLSQFLQKKNGYKIFGQKLEQYCK